MKRKTALLAALAMALVFPGVPRRGGAAPKPELWPRWEAHVPGSSQAVDHREWDRFLARNVNTEDPSGIYLLRYGGVSAEDREALGRYLEKMQGVAISGMDRPEQRAYWINLYNSLTVKIVLDHYPVNSIRDIDISPGLFADGPWDADLVTVESEKISLNDIEHRILRPIWSDSRLHYALNCASRGCPNLQAEAFTAGNTERLLEKGAREYVNHPRGARFEGRTLYVSSIYDWFRVDFGGSERGVIEHLMRYAQEPLAAELRDFRGKVRDSYDWSLNEENRSGGSFSR